MTDSLSEVSSQVGFGAGVFVPVWLRKGEAGWPSFAVGRKSVSFLSSLLASFGGPSMLSGVTEFLRLLARFGVLRVSVFLWTPPLRTESLGERLCLSAVPWSLGVVGIVVVVVGK